QIVAFMGGYHGVSLGALAATGNKGPRRAAGTPLDGVTFVPFADGPFGPFDGIRYIDNALNDANSGFELPAAVIVETIQAEGGVYIASAEWLQALADLCHRWNIVLICDEIQVGCGRAGTFFSFERAGIRPDIVTMSKSISGYGLPMSIVLMHRQLDN